MTFGEKVIQILHARHKTQSWLAERLGVGRDTISRGLHTQDVHLKVARRVADALGMKLEKLVEDVDYKKTPLF